MKYAIAVLVLVSLCGLVVAGCVTYTPEQQALITKSNVALSDAAKTAEQVKATFDAYAAEYDGIKKRVDAGEAIPAILVSRYTQLAALIFQAKNDVQESVAKVTTAKVALKEAIDSGVPWYAAIPWATILVGALSLAGGYFPAAASAFAIARTVIQAVGTVTAKDPAAGQVIKDAVLAQSRADGTETSLDKLVQRVDPPPPKAAA